jgi:hypothetical protein
MISAATAWKVNAPNDNAAVARPFAETCEHGSTEA